jgi:DNA-binding response OmpR family regulator
LSLHHHHVLVVEDEILIALELRDELLDAGARVVGPAMSVAEALRLIENEKPTAAILDVNLGSEVSLPVAQWLEAAAVPFILHTGNLTNGLPHGWPQVRVVKKPAPPEAVISALIAVLLAAKP